jgi:exopolysaccharide production protein ExoQ
MFLVWNVLERLSSGRVENKIEIIINILLIMTVFWLICISHSSTSLVCLLLGIFMVVYLRRSSARRLARYLGTFAFVILFTLVLLYTVPGVLESFVGVVDREMTFTGRTDIWSTLLKEPINRFLGTGYQSFWLGPGAVHLWEQYYFHPNQAHNGYLETYLNVGFIGLFLLLAVIVATGKKLKNELIKGGSFGMLLFSYMVVFLLYNWTEAVFNKLNPIWLIIIVSAVWRPRIKSEKTDYAKIKEFSHTEVMRNGVLPPAPSPERGLSSDGGILAK